MRHALSLIPEPSLTQKQRGPQINAVRAELREQQQQLFLQLRVLAREMREIARAKRERDKLVALA